LSEEPYKSWIQDKRIGLITNQTGVDGSLRSSRDVLGKQLGVHLAALFGPEHGIDGHAQAGETIISGPKVFSLYGSQRSPTQQMLRGIDVLIYDIQDVGVRFYTFISTMYEAMKTASAAELTFIVLDRPNPIGGDRVEGPVLETGFESFVGIYRLPVRYGMTCGEIALLLAQETGLELDLRIVPIKGWKRSDWHDELGLEWIAPSPNMPTLKTATVYPGFCLIEGTNLSEGRGTTRPFELVGAPWLDSAVLAERLNSLALPGVYFRSQPFTPTFSKYSGQPCSGVQIHVIERKNFRPIQAALQLIQETLKLHQEEFRFRPDRFDRLAGNSWIRETLINGGSVNSMLKKWTPELEDFRKRRASILLY
jgi:uncharacterized protein YbbC (DUF1343 family)